MEVSQQLIATLAISFMGIGVLISLGIFMMLERRKTLSADKQSSFALEECIKNVADQAQKLQNQEENIKDAKKEFEEFINKLNIPEDDIQKILKEFHGIIDLQEEKTALLSTLSVSTILYSLASSKINLSIVEAADLMTGILERHGLTNKRDKDIES